MNKIKKVIASLLICSSVFAVASCSSVEESRKKAMNEAEKECEKVAEEYFEAIADGDFDKAAEYSLYPEDYDKLHDYSGLTFNGIKGGLHNSSDSYNGYYATCDLEMNGVQGGGMIYFAYIKSERRWMINTVQSDYGTATYCLESSFYGER